LSVASPNRLWMLAWTVLWVGGCADSDVREDEQAPEPTGRREVVILTPADSVSTPADTTTSDTSDTSDTSPVFFDPDGQFTIQVGVYRDATRAEQKVRALQAEGYPAYNEQSDTGVRVRIGYFATRADADRFGRIFAQDSGVEYWIAQRAHE